MPWTVEEKTFV